MHFLEDITKNMINLITTPLTVLETFPPTDPPLSSIFILIVALFVSLASTLVSRKMIDVDKLKRLTRETKEYQKLRMQMLKTADSKMKLKYERNADRMRKVQSELTMMNLKPLLIMFIPMIIFFMLLNAEYSPTFDELGVLIKGKIPAIIPFALPESILILPIGDNQVVEGWGNVFVPRYIWWYFGGSLAFGSILRKLVGLQPD